MTARVGEPRDAAGAAAAMEAYFLRRVLSEVHVGGAFAGQGTAGATFLDMFNEALADQMADAGGVGLATQLVAQLGGAAGAAASPPPARLAGRYAAGAGALTVTPVEGRITSPVGPRILRSGQERFHQGVDIPAPMGTPVRSAGGGVVTRAGTGRGYGNLVVVDHGGGLETRYAHLSRIDVQVGQAVPAGAVVGLVGSTGNSVGPHLHLEVRRGGEVVDPVTEVPGLGRARSPLKDGR